MKAQVENGPCWSPEFAPQQAIFDDLRALTAECLGRSWPSISDLNALLPEGVQTTSGQAIRLVQQPGKMSALDYERQIWRSGQVPTRLNRWHDLFNVLMWSLFPGSKACLNQLHNRCDSQAPTGQRSRLRDALTLIDECGILIASCDPAVRVANLNHDWQQLFIRSRDRWFVDRKPMILGHGLYEQCLNPYLGLTAKALHIQVEPEFFELTLTGQYREIDNRLQSLLQNSGQALNSGDLLAFPVLGVPGWHPDNQDREFYDQKTYFRPRKR